MFDIIKFLIHLLHGLGEKIVWLGNLLLNIITWHLGGSCGIEALHSLLPSGVIHEHLLFLGVEHLSLGLDLFNRFDNRLSPDSIELGPSNDRCIINGVFLRLSSDVSQVIGGNDCNVWICSGSLSIYIENTHQRKLSVFSLGHFFLPHSTREGNYSAKHLKPALFSVEFCYLLPKRVWSTLVPRLDYTIRRKGVSLLSE